MSDTRPPEDHAHDTLDTSQVTPTRSPLKLVPGQFPAYMLQDMRAYLLSVPGCSLGLTLSGEPPINETPEFASRNELTQRLHLFIGRGEDTFVCFVVLHRPFLAQGHSVPPGAWQGPHYPRRMLEIYDASTGHLLVHGGYPTSS